jgi:hypothetical protein
MVFEIWVKIKKINTRLVYLYQGKGFHGVVDVQGKSYN